MQVIKEGMKKRLKYYLQDKEVSFYLSKFYVGEKRVNLSAVIFLTMY